MSKSRNKAFFLDRDGVLNHSNIKNGKPYPPSCLEEFRIIPGVSKALKKLREEGYLLIVVTNQPDVGRGVQRKEVVESMHAHLSQTLLLDDIEVCYDENNFRYKPSPGMILDAAKKHQIDLGSSYMVGDRWRDIGAGRAAGCKTVFIDHHYHEEMKEVPDFIYANLEEAVDAILGGKKCWTA